MQDDLIYDVGMNNGDDAAYYLEEGYRVLAIEANPQLAEAAAERFAGPLDEGRLEILNVGVAEDEGVLPFYVNEENDHWSSFIQEVGWRDGTRGHVVTVPAVDFAACLREHGVPHYLKIDIEASDMLCLEALNEVEPEQRPRYVSIEAEAESWSAAVRQFDLLARLGYTRFAIVQQGDIGERVAPIVTFDGRTIPCRFEMFSSGPFGEDLACPWLAKHEAMRRYRRIFPALLAAHAFDQLPKGTEIRHVVAALVRRPLPGWFDIHAAR